MTYLHQSERITGYKVKTVDREAFRVTGYTLVVQPGKAEEQVPRFWSEVKADGRLEKLKEASLLRPWVLGLGSWDPECPQHGHRYTICLEETDSTDFAEVGSAHPLYTKEIGASLWMCFETTQERFLTRFWKDDPYRMMRMLGYKFHTREGDYSLGLHFDAYPPHYGDHDTAMEFWITVTAD